MVEEFTQPAELSTTRCANRQEQHSALYTTAPTRLRRSYLELSSANVMDGSPQVLGKEAVTVTLNTV